MRFLAGIPVFNEKSYVERVISQVRRYASDVAVVDDGSSDGSEEVLGRLAEDGRITHLIRHPVNQGYGQALISLLRLARNEGYDCLVTLDCDEQHQPSSIPAFVRSLGGWDIVSGTRYPDDPYDQMDAPPADRLAINTEITAKINELTGYGLTDSFCGFKAYGRCALETLAPKEPGYGMPLELWIQAWRMGLRVHEIPVLRIYKDQSRTFGDGLDDSAARLAYYYRIIESALKEAQA